MTSTEEKLRALFLSALMVLSVFGGTIALAGTAAAGNSSSGFAGNQPLPGADSTGVTADDTPDANTTIGATQEVADITFGDPGNVTTVTVNLTGGDEGSVGASSVDEITVSLENGSTVVANQTVAYDSHNTTVDFGQNVTGVDGLTVDAHISQSASNGDVLDAQLYVQTNPTGTIDTKYTQNVTTTNTGFISGRVSDQNNNDVPNATVVVQNSTTGFYKETTTNAQGEYTIEVPAGTYEVYADKSGYATASPKDQTVAADSTTTANFVIRKLVQPDEIIVEQSAHQAVANGEDTITFNVTVIGTDGEPYENADVIVTDNGESITYDPARSGNTYTTESDGSFQFDVSSTVVQEVTFNFTVASNHSITQEETKNFVQAGEGNLGGVVYNKATTSGLEDASVWVVSQDDYATNENLTTIDLTSLPTDDDSTVWVRLKDNETGSIINNDAYDLRQAEGNDGTHVRKVEALNTTNAAVGQGYALIDADGDGTIAFNHTRLAPENYYAQISADAWNASTAPEVVDNSQENFVNVTSITGPSNTVNAISGTDPVVFTPSANLTIESAMDLSEQTGANYVDAPGFVNSFGYDTGGTTAGGHFSLSKLPTDFQNGTGYVAIATKVGYTADFADVTITENGQLTFNESQGENAFFVEPVPVQPDGVDIQQVGTRENVSAPLNTFADQTDDTYQRVSRDGSTVDVFRVNTTAEGELVNATVDVWFDDTSVEGEFVAIDDGTFVSRNNTTNTATLTTGADGQAWVWYQADQDSTTVDTKKWAQLQNDLAVTDYSNVTFVGVTEFQEASVSGIVTDTNDDPLPNSAVWAHQFQFGDNLIVIEPNTTASPDTAAYADAVDEDSDEFDVTLYAWNSSSGAYDIEVNSATLTASTLNSYDFSDFPSIDNGGTENYKLYDRTSDTTDASYTLDPVPALNSTVTATNYRIAAVKFDAPFEGADSNDALASVYPQTTDDANVVIPIDVEAAALTVNGVSNTTITAGENVSVSATIENTGGNQGSTQTVELTVDGNVVASQQVTVESGDSVTVTLEGDTSGLAAGNYSMTVSTADDSQSATLTVEEGSTGIVDQYDTNNDGSISITELGVASGDYANGDISIGELGQIAGAYASN